MVPIRITLAGCSTIPRTDSLGPVPDVLAAITSADTSRFVDPVPSPAGPDPST